MRRRLTALSAVSVLLFATAACGSGDQKPSAGASSSASVDMGTEIPGVQVSGAFGKEPTVKVDAPLKVDKTQSQVLTLGKGTVVQKDTAATLHLEVVNGTTGKKAVGTYDQGPITGVMSKGQVFPAVLDAVVGKPVGSRIVVASTPQDAFQGQGATQYGIKATDPVVFVVDVMSAALPGPQGSKAQVPDNLPRIVQDGDGNVTNLNFDKAPAKPSGKLQVIPIVNGTGEPVKAGDNVTFDYFGEVYGGTKPFDESYSSAPRTFQVGTGNLIKAWDQGLVGVKTGSRVMIIAPPEYGYGSAGNPQAGIKGTDTLVFVVDVLGVSR